MCLAWLSSDCIVLLMDCFFCSFNPENKSHDYLHGLLLMFSLPGLHAFCWHVFDFVASGAWVSLMVSCID